MAGGLRPGGATEWALCHGLVGMPITTVPPGSKGVNQTAFLQSSEDNSHVGVPDRQWNTQEHVIVSRHLFLWLTCCGTI